MVSVTRTCSIVGRTYILLHGLKMLSAAQTEPRGTVLVVDVATGHEPVQAEADGRGAAGHGLWLTQRPFSSPPAGQVTCRTHFQIKFCRG
jgi:hypothetical protein